MDNYTVVTAKNIPDLIKAVNLNYTMGWICVGGLLAVTYNELSHAYNYSQAMVRENIIRESPFSAAERLNKL